MICKHCGESLKKGDRVCGKCGRPVTLETGNGFWDLAQKKPLEPLSEPESAPESGKDVKQPQIREKRQKRKAVSPALFCLVSILYLLLTLGELFYLRCISLKLENTEALADKQLQTVSGIKTTSSELLAAAKIREASAVETEITEEKEPEETESEPVTSEEKEELPESVILTRSVGYEDSQDECLFEYRALSFVRAFIWQKKNSNGEWIDLEFGEKDGTNKEYGLKQIVMYGKRSLLLADGLTEESAGLYRCVIKTLSETTYSPLFYLDLEEEETESEPESDTEIETIWPGWDESGFSSSGYDPQD